MYAIVTTGGKQVKVAPGEIIAFAYLKRAVLVEQLGRTREFGDKVALARAPVQHPLQQRGHPGIGKHGGTRLCLDQVDARERQHAVNHAPHAGVRVIQRQPDARPEGIRNQNILGVIGDGHFRNADRSIHKTSRFQCQDLM